MLSKLLIFAGFVMEAWLSLSWAFGLPGTKALLPAGLALYLLGILING